MNKKTIKDLLDGDILGKRIFVRVDFNVPLDDSGHITDDTRIRAALPTIAYLSERGGKVILCSHLGRPDGKVVEKLRLTPIANRLGELLGTDIHTTKDCIGDEVTSACNALQNGEVLLLENVRFHGCEEKNTTAFSAKLAALCDIYVNDAFGTAHRAHASTEGVARLTSTAVAGLLVERELNYLDGAIKDPARPFAAVLGGSKVSSKIGVIESLLEKCNVLILGGGMTYTFLKAQGYEVGKSIVELDRVEYAKALIEKAKAAGVELILPVDVVVADDFSATANTKVVAIDAIPADWQGLDIGPKSIALITTALAKCKTVLWNGPVGVFELEPFSKGTFAIAKTLADLTDKGSFTSIIGGGDSVAAVEQVGLSEHMSHLSTGGGASLELLEGKELPGIAALNDK